MTSSEDETAMTVPGYRKRVTLTRALNSRCKTLFLNLEAGKLAALPSGRFQVPGRSAKWWRLHFHGDVVASC